MHGTQQNNNTHSHAVTAHTDTHKEDKVMKVKSVWKKKVLPTSQLTSRTSQINLSPHFWRYYLFLKKKCKAFD
jgi:hypothetical protein